MKIFAEYDRKCIELTPPVRVISGIYSFFFSQFSHAAPKIITHFYFIQDLVLSHKSSYLLQWNFPLNESKRLKYFSHCLVFKALKKNDMINKNSNMSFHEQCPVIHRPHLHLNKNYFLLQMKTTRTNPLKASTHHTETEPSSCITNIFISTSNSESLECFSRSEIS